MKDKSQDLSSEYVHLPEGEEIGFPERFYTGQERILDYKGKEIAEILRRKHVLEVNLW
jgi:hypothetical protein